MDNQIQYPQKILNFFNNCNIDIFDMMELDISSRGESNDYIDYIKPEEMTHPIMKFKDKFNRHGFLFRIKGKTDDDIKFSFPIEETIKIKNIEVTLAIFQRFIKNPFDNRWEYAWGDSNPIIPKIYDYLSCQNITFTSLEDCLGNLCDIINNKNELFGLV